MSYWPHIFVNQEVAKMANMTCVLLPAANEPAGKVIFSQVSVCHSVQGDPHDALGHWHPPPLDTRHGAYPPPSLPDMGPTSPPIPDMGPTPCYWHLVVITRDLFNLFTWEPTHPSPPSHGSDHEPPKKIWNCDDAGLKKPQFNAFCSIINAIKFRWNESVIIP